MNDDDVTAAVKAFASQEKAIGMQRFFKTAPGEYAEGDRFLGVTNPQCRKVVSSFADLPLEYIEKLLQSEWHEIRLVALLIAVKQFRRGDRKLHKRIFDLYYRKRMMINNWDLVDLSAPDIVGMYDYLYRTKRISSFASSLQLWDRRIAIVSTLAFIRHGEFDLTLMLADAFMQDDRDLIRKACGWMLREVGKRDKKVLSDFLDRFASRMPRTMLRYAIEHYSPAERKYFLAK